MRKSLALQSLFSSLLFLPFLLFGQENLIKEKIYTLKPNEKVAYGENALGLYNEELGYIIVTAEKATRTYHIKGEAYGPFDRQLVEKPVFNLESWGFIDSQGDTSYVFYNGDKIGEYPAPLYPVGLKVSKDSWAYILIDQIDGSNKIVINNREYGPFNLQSYHLSEDGNRWAVVYEESPEKNFVYFNNGLTIGPYKRIINFEFIGGKGNRWVLAVEPVNVLPKEVGEVKVPLFSIITNTGEVDTFEQILVGDDNYLYEDLVVKGDNYGQNVVKDQKIYFLANSKLYGPYNSLLENVDMGSEYNKFNYIDPATQTLHFSGDGIFARRVKSYYVSQSRKSVAVIKKATARQDSLVMNAKYPVGLFNEIVYLKFAPNSEEWALLSNNQDGTYTIHFSDKRQEGPYRIDISGGFPSILLGQDTKNWGFYYKETGTGKFRLFINGQERKENLFGEIASSEEDGQEYFSWFSLEDEAGGTRTIYLNRLLFK